MKWQFQPFWTVERCCSVFGRLFLFYLYFPIYYFGRGDQTFRVPIQLTILNIPFPVSYVPIHMYHIHMHVYVHVYVCLKKRRVGLCMCSTETEHPLRNNLSCRDLLYNCNTVTCISINCAHCRLTKHFFRVVELGTQSDLK